MQNFFAIMRSDELAGSDPMDDIGEQMISVRMTRSFKIAKNFASTVNDPSMIGINGVVMVFDQAKLAHRYKMFPFQDQLNGAERSLGSSEFEEVIKGDIRPMSPYLIGFYASSRDIQGIAGNPEARDSIREYILADMSDDEIIALCNDLMHHPKRLGNL